MQTLNYKGQESVNFSMGLIFGVISVFYWKSGLLAYYGIFLPICLTYYLLINYKISCKEYYSTRKEAEENRPKNKRILYDEYLKKYYIKK